jgi:hypothetical protein
MIRPDPRTMKALAIVARQHPEVLEWMRAWRDHELKRLPYATNHAALFQGRCQVLDDLVSVVQEAPVSTAKV